MPKTFSNTTTHLKNKNIFKSIKKHNKTICKIRPQLNLSSFSLNTSTLSALVLNIIVKESLPNFALNAFMEEVFITKKQVH